MIVVDPEQQKKENDAVNELSPFLRDDNRGKSSTSNSTSQSSSSSSKNNNGNNNNNNSNSVSSTRGLAILYASSLHVPDVRSMCEAFGALESFRSDFGTSLGVYLVTFYDLRSAQLAVNELPKVLNNKGNNNGGGRVQVKYCVPLNSSNATDESLLMISGLPSSIDEQDLSHVLSSFGEVRAIHYQANMSSSSSSGVVGDDDYDDGDELSSYLVEFYDVQDARQALLELEQTNPWGNNVSVKVGTRSPTKRKLGKDMIMLMSRWRQGVVHNKDGQSLTTTTTTSQQSQQQQHQSNQHQTGSSSPGNTVSPTPSPSPLEVLQHHQHLNETTVGSSQTSRTSHVNQQQHDQMQQHHQMDINRTNSMESSHQSSSYYQYPNQNPPGQHLQQQYQLVVGPDGQYQYVLMNNLPTHHHLNHPQMIGHPYVHHPTGGQVIIDPHTGQQHIIYSQPTTHVDHQLNYMHPHINPQQQYHIQYGGGPASAAAGIQLGYGTLQVDVPSQQQQQSMPPTPFIRLPSDVNSNSVSSGSQLSPGGSRVKSSSAHSPTRKSTASIGSVSSGNNSGGGTQQQHDDEEDNKNLTLSIENVKSGIERRTSLMVRNIPNKYTQQMLLSEFAAAGHGSDRMDFFYLPIDFKNKCNRGYGKKNVYHLNLSSR